MSGRSGSRLCELHFPYKASKNMGVSVIQRLPIMKNSSKIFALAYLVSLVAFMGCSSSNESSSAGVDLFDGNTLDGWQNFGGGKFYVEDGMIVGEAAPILPNSFLATEKMYDDFELEVDFLVDPLLNSGIQIRSHVYEKETATVRWGGTFNDDGSKNVRDRVWEKGRFWGYQIEIDPTDRGWSGTLYEEGARGFLHTPGEDEAALKAFKPGEWNHFRIIANGDHIQTWLNGVPVADVHDDDQASGYIALQLHGIGKSKEKIGEKVRWRNIRLKSL